MALNHFDRAHPYARLPARVTPLREDLKVCRALGSEGLQRQGRKAPFGSLPPLACGPKTSQDDVELSHISGGVAIGEMDFELDGVQNPVRVPLQIVQGLIIPHTECG